MAEEVMQETAIEESETSFDYDNLFSIDDSEDETTEETTEENTSEDEETTTEGEEETAETTEETTEEETVDFKYLGQTSKLSKSAVDKISQGIGKSADEVVALLQKGMNYGNSPLDKLIGKYADANGMNREDYIKFLENGLNGLEENVQRNKVVTEHPDWDDEKVNLAVQLELSKVRTEKANKEEQAKKNAEYELYKPHLEFMAKYPDVKEYPEEVAKEIDKGVSPIIAYQAYLNEKEYAAKLEELNKKIAQQERKMKNKTKSTGSLKDNGTDEEHDWFSEGLFG